MRLSCGLVLLSSGTISTFLPFIPPAALRSSARYWKVLSPIAPIEAPPPDRGSTKPILTVSSASAGRTRKPAHSATPNLLTSMSSLLWRLQCPHPTANNDRTVWNCPERERVCVSSCHSGTAHIAAPNATHRRELLTSIND